MPNLMRKITLAVAGLLVLVLQLMGPALAASRSGEHTHPSGEHAHLQQAYHGPYFGENNFPPGCTRDASRDNPENICFHMLDVSGINPLDSPQIDVLILLPVSPTVERERRILQQAVEMWDGGIDYLAPQMGLDWLAEGVVFHITVDYIDLTGDDGGEFTTYPVVDPEIVVIGAVPGAGVGAGLDVLSMVNEDGVPCHGIANPLDFEYWEALPGFNSHHDGRSGTFVEDCGGQGGNVCFAVNTGMDPEPTTIDWHSMFDLVAHEFGHCLSLGHVGDGSEAILGNPWGPIPFDDIMSYSDDNRMSIGSEPMHRTKCVSTLDVELFAIRMSHYLDVDGDGAVGPEDALEPNDQIGFPGARTTQVQHPGDHLYASSTGLSRDCPQPDRGLLPGPRTDWTPEPVPVIEPVLEVTSPLDGGTTSESSLVVTGAVSERSLVGPPIPLATSVTYDDDPADATGPFTEIASVTATATERHVDVVMQVGEIWPDGGRGSQVSYSLIIGNKRLDSFVLDPKRLPTEPLLWDGFDYVPGGSTRWDPETREVLFSVPRQYLNSLAIRAPYQIAVTANLGGTPFVAVRDDWAPEPNSTIDIAAPPEQLAETVEDPSDDNDRDGVPDAADNCPTQPGLTADGCTAQIPTRIEVSVDGVLVGAQDVYADYGPDDFAIPVELSKARRSQTIEVAWLDESDILASHELTVTRRRGVFHFGSAWEPVPPPQPASASEVIGAGSGVKSIAYHLPSQENAGT